MAGLKELKSDFDNLIKTGKISHGYIFFGSGLSREGESKKLSLAKYIANQLENGTGADSKVFIDSMIVDARESGGIDIIRRGISFLWQRPIKSHKRIFIIHNSENLTLIAQQAILKIAEEPPKSAIVIMTVKNPESLIVPLASRFQKIFFSEGSRLDFLKNYDFKKISREFLSANRKMRTEIIKEIIQEKNLTERFINDIIVIAYRNRQKNAKLLKLILERLCLIKQFNVNKKLQLESILLDVKL